MELHLCIFIFHSIQAFHVREMRDESKMNYFGIHRLYGEIADLGNSGLYVMADDQSLCNMQHEPTPRAKISAK